MGRSWFTGSRNADESRPRFPRIFASRCGFSLGVAVRFARASRIVALTLPRHRARRSPLLATPCVGVRDQSYRELSNAPHKRAGTLPSIGRHLDYGRLLSSVARATGVCHGSTTAASSRRPSQFEQSCRGSPRFPSDDTTQKSKSWKRWPFRKVVREPQVVGEILWGPSNYLTQDCAQGRGRARQRDETFP